METEEAAGISELLIGRNQQPKDPFETFFDDISAWDDKELMHENTCYSYLPMHPPILHERPEKLQKKKKSILEFKAPKYPISYVSSLSNYESKPYALENSINTRIISDTEDSVQKLNFTGNLSDDASIPLRKPNYNNDFSCTPESEILCNFSTSRPSSHSQKLKSARLKSASRPLLFETGLITITGKKYRDHSDSSSILPRIHKVNSILNHSNEHHSEVFVKKTNSNNIQLMNFNNSNINIPKNCETKTRSYSDNFARFMEIMEKPKKRSPKKLSSTGFTALQLLSPKSLNSGSSCSSSSQAKYIHNLARPSSPPEIGDLVIDVKQLSFYEQQECNRSKRIIKNFK